MDPTALRVHIYDVLLARGLPPTCRELADRFGISETDARRAIAELKIGKTILTHPDTGEIWMAGPFSAAPSPYRVAGSKAQWWANCAWDMLGVAMIAREEVHVEARCTDCGDDMSMRASHEQVPTTDGVVHFLVPARRWYDDIGFT